MTNFIRSSQAALNNLVAMTVLQRATLAIRGSKPLPVLHQQQEPPPSYKVVSVLDRSLAPIEAQISFSRYTFSLTSLFSVIRNKLSTV